MPDELEEVLPDTRSERDFIKGLPKYFLGDRFDLHMERMLVLKGLYEGLTASFLKKALYASLQSESFVLAAPEMNPQNFAALTFQQYADKLGDIFEPASEREAARIEFEARCQQHGEHPTFYYRDKLNLFLKGYNVTHRDYNFFYNKTITGLLNMEMKNYLRLHLPEPITDTNAFRDSMVKIANIIRRKYIEGEISENMVLGAEAFNKSNSYLDSGEVGDGLGRVKAEPTVHAVGKKPANIGPCYYCKRMGHLKAQCPRRSNGLPPAVSSVDPQAANTSTSVNATLASGNRRQQPVKPFNKSAFYARTKRFNNKRRIMYVFEDEQGDLVCSPLEDDEEDGGGTEADTQLSDKVQAVTLDNQKSEEVSSDFVPLNFLGL